MTEDMHFEFEALLQALVEMFDEQMNDGIPDLMFCLEGNLKADLQSLIRENGYPIKLSQNKAALVQELHEHITEAFEGFLDIILLDREFPYLVQLCFENGTVKEEQELAPFMEMAGLGFMFFEETPRGSLLVFPVDLMERFVGSLTEERMRDMFMRTAYNRFMEGIVNSYGSYPMDRLHDVFSAAFSEEMNERILGQLLNRERTDLLSYFVRDGELLHGGLKDPVRYQDFKERSMVQLPYYALSLKEVMEAGAQFFDPDVPVVQAFITFLTEVTDRHYEVMFLMWHIILMAKMDEPPEALHQFLKGVNIRFTHRQEIIKIFKLYEAYSNQVRKWHLRGHTRKEAHMLLERKRELAKPAKKRRARPNPRKNSEF